MYRQGSIEPGNIGMLAINISRPRGFVDKKSTLCYYCNIVCRLYLVNDILQAYNNGDL